jgi:trehalose-6-phosphate synthase
VRKCNTYGISSEPGRAKASLGAITIEPVLAVNELVAGQVHSLSKAGDYQHVCYRDETRQPDLEATISDIALRINSAYTTLEHQPLIFLRQDLLSAQYVALITVAESATVMSATYCADRRSCLRNIKG